MSCACSRNRGHNVPECRSRAKGNEGKRLPESIKYMYQPWSKQVVGRLSRCSGRRWPLYTGSETSPYRILTPLNGHLNSPDVSFLERVTPPPIALTGKCRGGHPIGGHSRSTVVKLEIWDERSCGISIVCSCHLIIHTSISGPHGEVDIKSTSHSQPRQDQSINTISHEKPDRDFDLEQPRLIIPQTNNMYYG